MEWYDLFLISLLLFSVISRNLFYEVKMNRTFFLANLFFLCLFLFFQTAIAGGVKGKIKLEGDDNNAGILVYIEYVDSAFVPPMKHALMDQKDLMFVPEVLPVLAGTTVDFLNSDNVLHNVFTPSRCAGNFNLGTWPKGKIRSHTFINAGCFATILCDVHPEMQAWIAVLQNPYFTLTKKNGEYEINNVPSGNYKLIVWKPFYSTKYTSIKIVNNKTSEMNFSLKRKNR